MQEYLKNWKVLAVICLAAIGAGFGLGRVTAAGPKTIVKTETVEVVKEVEKKVIVEVEKKVDTTIKKGPVRVVKKKFDDQGKVTEEVVTDEQEVVIDEHLSEVGKTTTDEKSKESSKKETSETIVTESRDWLVGGSVTYGVSDAVAGRYTRPEIYVKGGYRVFSGVYPGIGFGYDTATNRLKVGLHVDVAF